MPCTILATREGCLDNINGVVVEAIVGPCYLQVLQPNRHAGMTS